MKISRIVAALGSVMAGGLLAVPVLVAGTAVQSDVTVVADNIVGDGNSIIAADQGNDIVAGAYK